MSASPLTSMGMQKARVWHETLTREASLSSSRVRKAHQEFRTRGGSEHLDMCGDEVVLVMQHLAGVR